MMPPFHVQTTAQQTIHPAIIHYFHYTESSAFARIFANRHLTFPVDNNVSRALFPKVVKIICDQAVGCGRIYPFPPPNTQSNFPTSMAGLTGQWINVNLEHICYAGRQYAALDNLGGYAGLSQDLMAHHLIQKTSFMGTTQGGGRGPYGPTHAETQTTQICCDLAFLALNMTLVFVRTAVEASCHPIVHR